MRLLLATLLAAACAAVAAAPAGAAAPMQTGLIDGGELSGPDADLALTRARATGATYYRLMLEWYRVAPADRPDGFDAANPADPAYDWSDFDRKVRLLAAHHLEPIVVIHYPPAWAGGGFTPSPVAADVGQFAHAAAERYSGSFEGLPRIRYWMVWNEANVELDFSPQYDGNDQPVSPDHYRAVLNAAADAIHGVRADDVVIAGALSPRGVDSRDYLRTMPPMVFMRRLLCMSDGEPPQPTCDQPAHFDVWAHHPYTWGGPTHKASGVGDVSVGDLPEMGALLRAAVRAGHVVSGGKVRFWATEFSWDTNPPDPLAVPIRLQARWVSEALYRMWKDGIGMVAWLQLRDAPYPEKGEQSGLWFNRGPRLACDSPKTPTLTSFSFPFVAYPRRRAVDVWGRTPTSRAGRVVLEQLTPRGWRRIGAVRADANGIFTGTAPLTAARGRFREPLVPPHDYYLAVLCDGPRDYWRLGERSGTEARNETGGVSGTYDAGARLGVAGAVPDERDTAVTLDGNGRVAIPLEWSPHAVELWLKTKDPGPAAAFSNRDDTSHYVYVGTSGDGRLLSFDGQPLESPGRVDDGRWHYVVYSYDGSAGSLYLDGALVASAPYVRIEGAADASIGYDASLGTHLNGSLDDVAIYDRPLSAAEVREHYAARNPRPTPMAVIAGRYVRARVGKVASEPFSLAHVGDHAYDPFGYPGWDGSG